MHRVIKNHYTFMAAAVAVLFCVCVAGSAIAEETRQAKVAGLKGEVKFLKAGASDWAVLEQGMILGEGDSIKTGKDSEVSLEFIGAKKTADVTVKAESEFRLKTFKYDQATQTEDTLLDIEIGNVLVKAEKLVGDSKFEVKTPTSIVGIRGTVFEVQVSRA